METLPPLHADGIGWELKPIPHLETIPMSGTTLANLSHGELLDYVCDLREDAGALRRTLYAALTCTATLTDQLTRARRTIAELQAALREQRRAA